MAPPGQPCHRQVHGECRGHHWRAAAWHDAWELHWRITDSESQHHFLQDSTRAFAWATVHFGFNRGHRDAHTFEGALKCGAMQRFRVAFNFKTTLRVNFLLRPRVSLHKRR